MQQTAPDPVALRELVDSVKHREGWWFALDDIDRGQGSQGLTLVITVDGPDAYHPERLIGVAHYFIVPAAAYDRRAWRRWLFDRVLDVEHHEAMEFFAIDGERPYAPNHGPGRDPYTIHEVGTDVDRRTSNRGVIKDEL